MKPCRLDPLTRYYLRDAGSRGPLVLMYHAVDRGDACPSNWVIPLRRFEAHLDLLSGEGFRNVPLEEIVNGSASARSVAITFDDGYEDNLGAVEALARRNCSATFFIVTQTIAGTADWDSDPHLAGRLMMSQTQLCDLERSGMSIGSHTLSHPRLPQLSPAAQEQEIWASRERLGEILGSPPSFFAYPYGLFDEVAESLVKRSGYQGACSTRAGYHRGGKERFRMRRLTIHGHDDVGTVARKLALADNDGSWKRLVGMAAKSVARRIPGRAPVT